MTRTVLSLFLISLMLTNVSAQARRVPPENQQNYVDAKKSAEMFDEAYHFARRKFEDLSAQKKPYSEAQRKTILLDQRQLAARYAAELEARILETEDFFFLGMLHIVAENSDGAAEAFAEFLAKPEINAEKAQTARSFLGVTQARKREFEAAEKTLAEYLKSAPVKIREQILIERELVENFSAVKNYDKAVRHGEAALAAAQSSLAANNVDSRVHDQYFDIGLTLFDIYVETKQNARVETTLETLQKTAVATQSINFYLIAIGETINFLVENKRKPEAMRRFADAKKSLETNFKDAGARAKATEYFKKRERHLKILGETAPEIEVGNWLGEQMMPATAPLTNLRGKVVLLDFWATWCVPCFEAFPDLTEWHQSYGKKGLQIIGLTRFYGHAKGLQMDEANELTYLQNFKREQRLPYPFAVGKSTDNQINFGAPSLPTMVLIDKKGIVRFVQAGLVDKDKLEARIQKLLAE